MSHSQWFHYFVKNDKEVLQLELSPFTFSLPFSLIRELQFTFNTVFSY